MKTILYSHSQRMSDEACFSLVAYLIDHGAPSFGKTIHRFRIDAYFDDLQNEVPCGENIFELYKKRLQTFPKVECEPREGSISVKYLSKVCLGKDLSVLSILVAKEHPDAINVSRQFNAFFLELIDVLKILTEYINPSDGFKTESFLRWLPTRVDLLPKTNGELYALSERVNQSVPEDMSYSTAMSIDEFWKLIDKTNRSALERGDQEGAVKPVVSALKKLSLPKIKSFHSHLIDALYAIDTRAHCERAGTMSDDWFLYARCYVVGRGRAFYESVLEKPANMPNTDVGFEYLLEAAPDAWQKVTGKDLMDFPKCSERSYETGSNRDGWMQTSEI